MNTKRVLALLMLLAMCCAFALAGAHAEEAAALIPSEDELVVGLSQSRTIKYTLTPKTLSKGGVTFKSSDESIARVNSKGQVTGKAVGECVITITSKKDASVSGEVSVQVVKPVKSIKAAAESKTLLVGQTMQITHTVKPEDATIQTATYLSRNEKVATVDENGLVTALARGTAKIVVRSVDGKAQHTLEFTVKQPVEEITFKKDEYNVVAGKSLKLAAKVLPSNANNKNLSWVSSDKTIATVDKNGNVKTKGVGDALIIATSQENDAVSAYVVVHSVNPIKSISFEQTVYDAGVGEQIQLKPVIAPAAASHTRLKYEAQNRQVCSVDENGLITTLRGGITTVKATSTDGSKRSATVTVRSIVPVEGAYFEQKSVRVDVGSHTFAYAKLEPLDATIKNMTWMSSNPAVATVSGTDNRVRIVGRSWGRCVITGVTEQGHYSASIAVNVGALRSPLKIRSVQDADGVPCVTVENVSDMHMTGMTFAVRKKGVNKEPIAVETDLAPGAQVIVPLVKLANEKQLSVAVSAWETDTGFYTNEDEKLYSYRISPGLLEWED